MAQTTSEVTRLTAELEEAKTGTSALQARLSRSENVLSSLAKGLDELATGSDTFAARLATEKNRVAVTDYTPQETAALASLAVVDSLLSDIAAAESRLAELELQKQQEIEDNRFQLVEEYERKLEEQKADLENDLNDRVKVSLVAAHFISYVQKHLAIYLCVRFVEIRRDCD